MVSKTKKLIAACLLIVSILFFSTLTWAKDSRRTVFKVSNLSCGACTGKIDAKLKTYEGYIGMLANIDKGLVVVDHGQSLTNKQIAEAITSIGYPAKVASESEYDLPESISSESPGWISPKDGFFARLFKLFNR